MTTYPLLQSQVGIYHAWVAAPASVAYNLPAVVPFSSDIDIGRLEQALQHIWQKRQELHTRIVRNAQGELRQWADPDMVLTIAHHHMNEQDAQSYINHGFVRPFAVSEGEPLARFEVVITEKHHYLLCDFHHLICDGMTLSHAFLATDLPAAYEGRALASQSYGLFQHAEAEQEAMHTEQYQRDARFYQEAFGDITFTSMATPTAHPWGERLSAIAPIDQTSINAWCQQQNVQPNYLFMAAFCIVLSRLSGNGQVAFVTLNHGRTDRRLTKAYGMFVTSVPILARLEESLQVNDLIIQLRRWFMSTVRHQTYPLTHLCRDLHKTPSITFAFQGQHIVEETTTGGSTVVGYQPVQGTTKNDLSCMIYEKGQRYEIRTEASSALWSQQRLHTFAKAVAACVENLMTHPNGQLSDIDIITAKEQAELLQLGQGEHLDYSPNETIVSLFLKQAQQTPQALAVTDGVTSLTYQELNLRSEAFAQQLCRQGMQAGDFVPITCGQCTDFLVEAIGIMRMGAAYVPIDPTWPDTHQQRIIDIARTPEKQRHMAYLICTSGTTGEPKAVMISHRALLNLVHSIVHIFGLTAESRISCHSSVAFDASVEDLFPVLTVGGSVHIMPDDIRRSPEKIHQFLLGHHITGGCYTTHLGLLLAEQYDLPMEYLCLGGERLTTYPHTQPRVFNTYGPTEFTVDATYHELPRTPQQGIPPIGRPLPNLTASVTDPHGHLLPRGEVGELCLSGPQKATNCKEEPYHTGDLVRWNDEGMLEYVGRRDRQLKLRGYRIEPEEVEQQLTHMEGIRQAVVLPYADGNHLCAYFTSDAPMTSEVLAAQLARVLPPYMVPDRFIQLPSMPCTTAGKPDYAALPAPSEPSHYTPPANEAEQRWCHLFETVLGIKTVGATDNFFHLGGTSITVASLQAEALQQGIQLSYGDVFAHPTPRQLANSEPLTSANPLPLPHHPSAHTLQIDVRDIDRPMSGTSADRSPGHRTRGCGSLALGTVLLTGSTGFLGCYMLMEMLRMEEGVIICPVRATDRAAAAERLRRALHQHEGNDMVSLIGTRIIPIAADLQSLTEQELPYHINTVIHCAADVRHFAPDHAIEEANIGGTDRIIDLCLAQRARLIHISTLILDDTSTNPYLRSKAIAEQHVINACTLQQLRATIMRVGNLTLPSGEMRGSLADTLQAFRLLGQYPLSLAHLSIDLSPVNQTARAILLLATHATGHLVLHPYNPHTITLASLLQDLQPVSDEIFQTTLSQALTASECRASLTPLLHYMAMKSSDGTIPSLPDNTDTIQMLAQLQFHFSMP